MNITVAMIVLYLEAMGLTSCEAKQEMCVFIEIPEEVRSKDIRT